MNSRIVQTNGIPEIEVDGKIISTNAYVTYFTENSTYDDFTKAGFNLYSICTYFTKLPINEDTGFTGARTGIFDVKGKPDYSEFDSDVEKLLKANKNAMIFPRIYISMPMWWLKEHPEECVVAAITPEGREMLFSDKFREDGGELLRQFIRHINSMPYANNIIGYQVSGGTTQEWFHFGRDGSFCANAFPYFEKFMAERKPGVKYEFDKFMNREYNDDFVDFSNDTTVVTVDHFARIAKEECNYKQIVGAFYGYSVEVQNPLSGTHALDKLIDSPNIDFYCSPVSYAHCRPLGYDWITMLPEDSLKLHGKIYVCEADVRTLLSRYPDECRKDITIKVNYRDPIWLGGPTEQLSIYQVRKPFAKLLTHSRGSWWFDMWGGWYATENLMAELKMQKEISEMQTKEVLDTKHKSAVLIDEKMYKHFPEDDRQREFCTRLSSSGVLYDMFLTSDIDRIYDKYDTFYMPYPEENEQVNKYDFKGKSVCKNHLADFNELRDTAKKAGTPIWIDTPDVIYCGNGFMALHAKDAGEKTVTMPENFKCTVLTNHQFKQDGNKVTFTLEQFDTIIFRIEK